MLPQSRFGVVMLLLFLVALGGGVGGVTNEGSLSDHFARGSRMMRREEATDFGSSVGGSAELLSAAAAAAAQDAAPPSAAKDTKPPLKIRRRRRHPFNDDPDDAVGVVRQQVVIQTEPFELDESNWFFSEGVTFQGGVASIPKGGWIKSKEDISRPTEVVAKIKSAGSSGCIAMTLFAPDDSYKNAAYSVVTGYGSEKDEARISPSSARKIIGFNNDGWDFVRFELADERGSVLVNEKQVGKFDDPSDQRSDVSDSGKVQFIAGCEPMKVQDVRWRIDCTYTPWIGGVCSATCGKGTLIATRTKNGGTLNGNGCSLETDRTEVCEVQACPSARSVRRMVERLHRGPTAPLAASLEPARDRNGNAINSTERRNASGSARSVMSSVRSAGERAENAVLKWMGMDESQRQNKKQEQAQRNKRRKKKQDQTKASCGCDRGCRLRVDWVMTKGLKKHPNWFSSTGGIPGLTAESTFAEVQQYMYDTQTKLKGQRAMASPPCKAACGCDTKCKDEVSFVLRTDIRKHPHRYAPFDGSPGLDEKSTLDQVQMYLFRKNATKDGEKQAPLPPCSAPTEEA